MWATRLITSSIRRRIQRSQSDYYGSENGLQFTEPSIQITSSHSTTGSRRRRLPRQSSSTVTDQVESNNNDNPHHQHSSSPPLLYALCTRWAWPAITFRAESHPHEVSAEHRESNGDTMLHWVCFGNPPVEAVTVLVRICPQLASSSNNNGLYPLHVAASYRASPEVVQILIQAYPAAASTPTVSGSYPLHLMCDYGCSVDSMRAILQTDQGASSVSREDKIFCRTPLHILNSRKGISTFHDMQSNLMKIRRTLRILQRLDANHDGDLEEVEADIRSLEEEMHDFKQVDFWHKVALLIHAEYLRHKLPEDLNVHHNIVNACVSVEQSCPPTLVELAMLLYPEQCREVNHRGDSPLHIAVARSGVTMMYDILNICPESARVRNAKGELAVQVAVRCGRRWGNGVRELLAAYPVGVETLSLDDRLYPLLWAKIFRRGGISALFESVQAKPSLFQ